MQNVQLGPDLIVFSLPFKLKLVSYWVIFHAFCCLLILFKIIFFDTFFQEHHQCQTVWIQIRPMSNSLDPDQAYNFVRPDLGPNCLQRLSADDTNRQRVKINLFLTNLNSYPANIFVSRKCLLRITSAEYIQLPSGKLSLSKQTL